MSSHNIYLVASKLALGIRFKFLGHKVDRNGMGHWYGNNITLDVSFSSIGIVCAPDFHGSPQPSVACKSSFQNNSKAMQALKR